MGDGNQGPQDGRALGIEAPSAGLPSVLQLGLR